MNSYIKLDEVKKDKRDVHFLFSTSDNLKKYFSNKPFIVHYPESIDSVPNSVVAVVFVCCVLPIIWMTDSVLKVNELDESFFNCIPEVLEGYKNMYPNIDFKGRVDVDNIVDNTYPDNKKTAMFYSCGLDSTQTLISHISERPLLLSIWGSDIKFENELGWQQLHSAIADTAKQFGLQEQVIKSSFREFDSEGVLHYEYLNTLGDSWWHGIKHSLALLGHVAPIAYINRISKMYIAASYCDKYPVTCASNPWVDNNVRFSGCAVVHDGYEFSRQDKIHNLVEYCNTHKTKINLHVCWKTQTGNNCCRCEKCFRTMIGIWAENSDPCNYGFYHFSSSYRDFVECFIADIKDNFSSIRFFSEIQCTAKNNKRALKKSPYYNELKWFLSVDFSDLKNVKMPLTYKLRSKLSVLKTYQLLHRVKDRIMG